MSVTQAVIAVSALGFRARSSSEAPRRRKAWFTPRDYQGGPGDRPRPGGR